MLEARYTDRNWRDHQPAESDALAEALDALEFGDAMNVHETPGNALPDWYARQIDRRRAMTDGERAIDDQRRNAQSRADDLEDVCLNVADKLAEAMQEARDIKWRLSGDRPQNHAVDAMRRINALAVKLAHAEQALRDAVEPPVEDHGDSLLAIESRELHRIHAAQVGDMNRMAM